MKKLVFGIVIAAIAASPSAAAGKKKKATPAPVTSSANNNENSWKFAKDSLPIFLPSWTMPAYVAVAKPAQTAPQR